MPPALLLHQRLVQSACIAISAVIALAQHVLQTPWCCCRHHAAADAAATAASGYLMQRPAMPATAHSPLHSRKQHSVSNVVMQRAPCKELMACCSGVAATRKLVLFY
jgi:hypothetical protein